MRRQRRLRLWHWIQRNGRLLVGSGAIAAAAFGPGWGFDAPGAALYAQDAAAAAKYDELPIPDGLDERGKPKTDLPAIRKRIQDLKLTVTGVLSGEQPLQANQTQFDGYYLQYILPQTTWIETIESPDKFNALVRARLLFLNDVKRATPAVHDHLIQIALTKCQEIAKGTYHPAARINAMLLISSLNQKELVSTGSPTPPEPYLAAVPVMIDALADKDQIDGVRVAAMLGILRAVQWDTRMRETRQQQGGQPLQNKIEDADRDRINQLAMAIINAPTPPAGRTSDGHAWMQRRAIDILGALGTIGTNVTAAQTIDNLVGDPKAPISLRCGAAEALGQINLPAETRLNPAETAGKLGELAVTACRNELKRIDDEKKAALDATRTSGPSGLGGMMGPGAGGMAPPGGGGMAPPGMMGPGGQGGMMAPGMMGPGGRPAPGQSLDEYKLEVAQRRLKSQLHSVKIGLAGVKDKTTGVMGLVADGSKERQVIAKLAEEVAGMRDLTDSEDVKDLDKLVSEVRKRIRDLETAAKATVALAKPAPAAKPKTDPDSPDADLPDADGPPAAKPAAKPKPADAPADAPAAAKPEPQPAEDAP